MIFLTIVRPNFILKQLRNIYSLTINQILKYFWSGMYETKYLTIGVLAIQGAFKEHEVALLKCLKENGGMIENVSLKVVNVTEASHLAELDGLVIPGGESTVISSILDDGMIRMLSDWSKDDHHFLFGTCAGLILLSKNIVNQAPGPFAELGCLDVTTSRNHFGRQLNSFEGCVTIKEKTLINAGNQNNIAKPDVCSGVFIRAPAIMAVNGQTVKTLATVEIEGQEVIVGVQDHNCIGLAFHPELTDDLRWHGYFLECIIEKKFKT